MTNSIIGFVGCFMFALVCLLIGVLCSKIHWIFKAILTVSSLAAAVLFYVSFIAALGWPLPGVPSGVVRFLWSETREPSAKSNDPGAVFLWYLPEGSDLPRTAELPFSKVMQERMNKAKDKTVAGIPVYMKSDGEGSGDGKDAGKDKTGGAGAGKSQGNAPKTGIVNQQGGPPSGDNREAEGGMNFVPPPFTVPPKDTD